MLVKMTRDGKGADVHPDEVENYKAGGWSVDKYPHLSPKQEEALDHVVDGAVKPGGSPKGGFRRKAAE